MKQKIPATKYYSVNFPAHIDRKIDRERSLTASTGAALIRILVVEALAARESARK